MTIVVQDHIHLSEALDTGPEFAPDTKWKVRIDGWMRQPEIISEHRRTLTGKLKKHVLKTAGGEVIQFTNYRYVIRVSDYWGKTGEARLNQLIAMNGKPLYLIDVQHPVSDGQNHSPYVKTMYMSIITDITQINPQLDPLYVSVELLDDFTVT